MIHGEVEDQESCVLMMEVVQQLGVPMKNGQAVIDKRE